MIDPVCGMEVEETTEYKSEYKGRTYCFCSAECKARFEAEPARYAERAQKAHHHSC
jgi:Cu+-exporting ATPase